MSLERCPDKIRGAGQPDDSGVRTESSFAYSPALRRGLQKAANYRVNLFNRTVRFPFYGNGFCPLQLLRSAISRGQLPSMITEIRHVQLDLTAYGLARRITGGTGGGTGADRVVRPYNG